MAFSNAQTKVESGKSLLTQAQTGREKARTELEQFWRKTAKEYGSVITEEELLPMTPNSSNVGLLRQLSTKNFWNPAGKLRII